MLFPRKVNEELRAQVSMLRASTEETPIVPPPLIGDDMEQLHESARERIRDRLRRATNPVVTEETLAPATADEPAVILDTASAAGEAPDVAPIPSVPLELPAPYESDQADEPMDLHEAARKRIRKITQPIELPLPSTRSTSYAAENDDAAPAPARDFAPLRRRMVWAGFAVALMGLAALLNASLIASAFNYDDLGEKQIRALAPELGGGYIIKSQHGRQFIGYLVREAGQTSTDRAGALAGRLLERLHDQGVSQVVLLDRDNIPVAVKGKNL
jgi:hypothetical protein